jgi:hypothetical protein
MRVLADIARIAILASALAFLAHGDKPAALKALLVLMPALASRLVRVPAGFDFMFAGALAIEALGSGLGAFHRIGWPEGASHLVIPFLSAPIVYQSFVRLGATPAPEDIPARRPPVRPGAGAGLLTAAGVLALGAVWELVEWGSDNALGTDYSLGYSDTLSDLLADTVAASGGGLLVAIWVGLSIRAPVRRARSARALHGPGPRPEEAA